MLVPWRAGVEQYCVNLYNSVSSYKGTVQCSVAFLQLKYHAKSTLPHATSCPLSFTMWRRQTASSVLVLWREGLQQCHINLYHIVCLVIKVQYNAV